MIQVKGLSKRFRSGRGQIHALRDVSFTLETGTATAVVGKSGSGKTTLLNCLGGLERPEQGEILCFSEKLLSLSARELSLFQRQKVGFIFQYGNLLSYLSVFDNIQFPLTLNGVEATERKKRVETLLERIGLKGAGAAMPYELSGGEVQRVSAARAMAHYPRILLADEPTASLDSETGRNLVDLLFGLGREQNCTLVVSTHDPEIYHLAARTIHLKDGTVIGGEE